MTLSKPFGEIGKGDAAIAGGKGASLGEMTQAGIPVPPGFVVLSSTFDRFLEETDLVQEIAAVLDTVNREEMHTVEHASEKIQALILNATMPADIERDIEKYFKELNAEFVAVRSSATAEDSASAAWAGQLDSYLNTTETTLLKNVQRCWASLFTPRAIFYRFEKELHKQKISVAVVVQKMVASEVSGIAFSVHPVTEDYNQLIIEAGFGLGEAIVSGQVTPDSYVVEKSPRKIIDTNVSTQTRALYRAEGGGNEWLDIPEPKASSQVLTEGQVLELSDLIVKIEKHYNFPCDIEWAFEGGTFYIVQSRPITTLSQKTNTSSSAVLEKYFTREFSLYEASVWRDANCKEEAVWLGANTTETVFVRPGSHETLEVWYSDRELDLFRTLIKSQIDKDREWFTRLVTSFEEHWAKMLPALERNKPLSLVELKEFYPHFLAYWSPMAITMQIPDIADLPADIREQSLKLRETTQEYTEATDGLFFKTFEHLYPEFAAYKDVVTPEEVLSGNLPSEAELKRRQGGWYMTNDSFGLIADLPKALAGREWQLGQITLSKVYSREKAIFYFCLWDLCDREGIQEFLGEEINANLFIERGKEKQGDVWYSQKELDRLSKISIEKLGADATLRKRVVDKMEQSWAKAAPYLSGSQKIKDVDEMYAYYRHIVDFWSAMNTVFFELPNNPDLQQDFKQSILKIREATEHYTDKMSANFVEFWESTYPEYAKFSYIITPEEAVTLAKSGDPALIKTLETRLAEGGCFIIKGEIWPLSKLDAVLKEKHLKLEQLGTDGVTEIKGQTAYPGKVTGTVRLVMNKKEVANVGAGDILVTPMTNPEYVPYMQKAAAFVTDEGGLTCHAAIVAREMKKPCVVGTKIATEVLKDGDLVEVDADKGVVRILKTGNDIANIDWELWIRRQDQPPFFNSQWIDIEGNLMRELIGGGFTKQLCLRYGDDNLWIRSTADFEHLRAGIKEFLNQKSETEIKALFEKADTLCKAAPAFLEEVRALSDTELLSQFEIIVTRVNEILLYTTSMPYFVLEMIEKNPPGSVTHSELIHQGAEALRATSFYRDLKVEVLNRIFEALANKFDVTARLAASLTVNETRETLAKGVLVVSPRELEGRETCGYWDMGDGKIVFSTDTGLMEKIRGRVVQVPDEAKAQDAVKGAVAFAGKVTGTARIVTTEAEMSKVHAGDILVAPTTNPSLMAAILACAAIVTDEGGIASHAAIISRELKKPCIVGTKYATHIIKDGDEIEVDADNGIVRIVKKNDNFAINPKGEIFRWGPLTVKHFYIGDYLPCYARPFDGFVWPTAIALFHQNEFVWLHDFADLRKVGGEVFTNVVLGDSYEKQQKAYKKALVALRAVEERIAKESLAKLTSTELASLLIETTATAQSVWSPTLPAELGNYGSIEVLKHELAPFVTDATEVDEIVRTLTTSEKLSFYQEEEIALEETSDVAEHQQKYFWLRNSYAGAEYLPIDFFAARKSELAPNLRKTHAERAVQIAKAKKSAIKKYKLPKAVVRMAERILDVMEWQDERKKETWAFQHYKKLLLDEVSKRTGRSDLEKFGLWELAPIVEGAPVTRADSFGFVFEQGLTTELDAEKTESYWETYTKDAKALSSEIKGIIANKGKVQGQVRVVRDPNSKNITFEEGDVLVAPMTSPDYVFLMKKSAAIVTDAGGLTSHAAIVSRELGKPCIVGTKVASQTLNDGDLVEVDADKGIVRIISKNTLSPADYIRMFANKSFAYLFSSIFLKYYDGLGVASVTDGESWMSFLPKVSHLQTLKEGAELYTSLEKYRAYKNAFDEYRETSAAQFEKWLAQKTLTADEVEAFLTLAAKHFSFYSKTEFFYTDEVDQKNMVISVAEFDELKLSGRAYLNKIMFEDEGYTRRLTKCLAHESGVPESEILLYEVEEVIKLVKSGLRVSQKTLNDRTVFFASVGYKVAGQSARALVDSFFASYRERATVINGTVAYKGRVRGKARVLIPDFNDFDKIKHAVAAMEKGEILVAETTAPEIILACHKAAAIVTNQGGTLSHAAIVSRELKIPCIIGTDKDVILNIKTGDEIEVDADRGVITIL